MLSKINYKSPVLKSSLSSNMKSRLSTPKLMLIIRPTNLNFLLHGYTKSITKKTWNKYTNIDSLTGQSDKKTKDKKTEGQVDKMHKDKQREKTERSEATSKRPIFLFKKPIFSKGRWRHWQVPFCTLQFWVVPQNSLF